VNCASVIANLPATVTFKRVLLLFWAVYFSISSVTNLVDLLGQLGAFHWTFLNSGNFDYVRVAVQIYDVGATPTKVLLTCAMAIEMVAAALFWRAFVGFGDPIRGRLAAFQALTWGTLVWFAFIFMTEFFIAYDAEPVFRDLILMTIATALAIALIPDDAATGFTPRKPGDPR
jgi:hypothetical protein